MTMTSWTVPMSFDGGVLPEPLLLFGSHRLHVDPKSGLAAYGPYSPADEPLPDGRTITVGIVGPAQMVGDAERWLEACSGPLMNDGSHPFQSPGFPGFNAKTSFRSSIRTGRSFHVPFRQIELEAALSRTAG